MLRTKLSPFSVLVVAEWVLILPATIFLVASALRLLQPAQYQPARTSWIIFQWAMTHISHFGAAALFIGLPAVVTGSGCAALVRLWRKDEVFCKEVKLMLGIVRRNLMTGFLSLVTLLGATLLGVVVAHVITD